VAGNIVGALYQKL